MENLIKFVPEQLFILIVALYVLGVFLKSASIVNDTLIPVLLMIFAIIFSLILAGFNATSFLQGILCWGASIGINQTYKQLKKEN